MSPRKKDAKWNKILSRYVRRKILLIICIWTAWEHMGLEEKESWRLDLMMMTADPRPSGGIGLILRNNVHEIELKSWSIFPSVLSVYKPLKKIWGRISNGWISAFGHSLQAASFLV